VPRNATEVLVAGHAELDDLFERVSGLNEDRALILKQLISKLSTHIAMEKQHVVPVLRDRVASDDGTAERLSDYHDAVARLVVLVERRKVNSPDMPELVTEILTLTRDHIADTDATVFPALRRACTPGQLDQLGQKMDSDEQNLLTHPHPHLPGSGPIAGLARKVVSAIDRKRDHTADLNRGAD
jgi:hypothetical protein